MCLASSCVLYKVSNQPSPSQRNVIVLLGSGKEDTVSLGFLTASSVFSSLLTQWRWFLTIQSSFYPLEVSRDVVYISLGRMASERREV